MSLRPGPRCWTPASIAHPRWSVNVYERLLEPELSFFVATLRVAEPRYLSMSPSAVAAVLCPTSCSNACAPCSCWWNIVRSANCGGSPAVDVLELPPKFMPSDTPIDVERV